MPENLSMAERAHELVAAYRALSRELALEDAARASSVIGSMLVEVERANLTQNDAAVRLAEDALALSTRLLHELHPRD